MKRLIPCLLLLVLCSAAHAQTTNPPNQISETTRVNTNSSHDFKFTVYEPAAGALTAALAGAGAGSVENGAHRYKVTFVTSQGQSVAGTASSAVTVVDKTANGKVSLSAIPTGSVFVTSRKVYRTVAGGTVYKLLTTIADNTTTTFTDNVADASLTTTAPTANTTANPWLTTDADTGVTTVYKLTIGSGGCSGCGTPGGSDTQVQFNDSSAFGGDAGLTYNKTTDTLTTVTFVGALTGTASGNQPLDSDLTTIAGLTATSNNVIQSVSSAWASRTPAQLVTTLALPYDVATQITGKPDASAVVLKFVATRSFALSATGHQCSAGTGANAQADFIVAVNGTTKDTLRFAAAGTTCSIVGGTAVTVTAGQVLTITAPGSQDSALADIALSLFGTLP